jgi:hypothetical protein
MKRNKTTSKNTQTGAEQQQAALNGISPAWTDLKLFDR